MPSLRSTTCAVLALLLLQACATRSEPGWQGQDATAFGTAESACVAETRDLASSERDFAFQACMGRHGWTRGAGSD